MLQLYSCTVNKRWTPRTYPASFGYSLHNGFYCCCSFCHSRRESASAFAFAFALAFAFAFLACHSRRESASAFAVAFVFSGLSFRGGAQRTCFLPFFARATKNVVRHTNQVISALAHSVSMHPICPARTFHDCLSVLDEAAIKLSAEKTAPRAGKNRWMRQS